MAAKKVTKKAAKKAALKRVPKAKPYEAEVIEEGDAVFGMQPVDVHDSRASRADIAKMGHLARKDFLRRRKDRLVYAIAKLMASGNYDVKTTLRRIAEEEDMTLSNLRNVSAEAGRLLQMLKTGKTEVVSICRARLLEIAMENGNDRVSAIRTVLENLGEMRQKVRFSRDEDFFAGWSEDEMAEYAETGKMPEGSE